MGSEDLDLDELCGACDFDILTMAANDDPGSSPAGAEPLIPGESPCDLNGTTVITRAEVDQDILNTVRATAMKFGVTVEDEKLPEP